MDPNPTDPLPKKTQKFSAKNHKSYIALVRSNLLSSLKSYKFIQSRNDLNFKEIDIERYRKIEKIFFEMRKENNGGILGRPDLVLITNDQPIIDEQNRQAQTPTQNLNFCHRNIIISNSPILFDWYSKSCRNRRTNNRYLTMYIKEYSNAIITIFIVFCYTGHLSYTHDQYEGLVALGNQFMHETFLAALVRSVGERYVC